MADIRLKTVKYMLAGKEYTLTCNMNVLAELQEVNDGEILRALNNARSIRTALQAGAAMLNDCAEENGWTERFTEKSLGRLIPPRETAAFSRMVSNLLYNALSADGDQDADAGEDHNEDDEKNAEASQSK